MAYLLGAMTVLRPTIKCPKLGTPVPGNPCPFSSTESSSHPLAYEITQPIKTKHPVFQSCLSPSETAHTLSMACASPWINLPLLHCGSLLNYFLCKTNKPHLAAIPGSHLRTGIWPFSHIPLSFLQYLPSVFQVAKPNFSIRVHFRAMFSSIGYTL